MYDADMESLEERRRQLKTAISKQWEYELREDPEFATIIGDYRYNDRWRDRSLSHVEERKRGLAAWLSRFDAIETTGFPEQERLDHQLMVRDLRERLEEIEFKLYEMPVDQLDGVHLTLAQFVTFVPLDSTQHYEEYIGRLELIPQLLDQVIEVLEQGIRDGLMPRATCSKRQLPNA